jgi:DcaP outer membrane protein
MKGSLVQMGRRCGGGGRVGIGLILLSALFGSQAVAQRADSILTIYGFAMTDMGFQFGQNHPDWFDVIRPTKLPAFEDEFGEDGDFYAGVRQTRFGVRGMMPVEGGDTLRATFEWELFGTGVDAGQTTLRLRHAYGEWNWLGVGQTWSPFMDIDVFPNSIEYWGPPGMAFFRNVQVRFMPLRGPSRVTIALERPGASGDQGEFADRLELQDITGRFPLPDLSAEGRWGSDWGYVELAGIARYISWDDGLADAFDVSGDGIGWGLNLSSNIKFSDHVFRASALYGEGIENYMNDAPADVAATFTGDIDDPIEGDLLPVIGISAFIDLNWSREFTSTIGYSMVDIDNTNGQSGNAFSHGDYALANILFYPVPGLMLGPEFQWGHRDNFDGDFSSDDFRLQFSAKYNFSFDIGGD